MNADDNHAESPLTEDTVSTRRLFGDIALYIGARFGVMVAIAGMLLAAQVPLLVAVTVGLIVGFPVGLLVLRKLNNRITAALAVRGRQRARQRATLRAQLRGEDPEYGDGQSQGSSENNQ